MDQQKDARPVVRRARGLQRIASILAAAETVFAHMGYEEATTNHIAAQARSKRIASSVSVSSGMGLSKE
jgi:AcrR family transcriptional regulator